MKCHIIAQRLEADRILPRLANMLSDNTNWSISDSPDEHADLNYFLPYLELDRFKSFNATPIMAWFSHYEENVPDKQKIWLDAAKRCDVRLTSARKYYDMLIEFGPTFIVTPPLDTSKFKPKI